MGNHVLNAEVLCDHATPEKTSAFRMHMDLTFPVEDLDKLHALLDDDRWEEFSAYFSALYPQHSQLIEAWCAGSDARRASGASFGRRDRHRALAA